MLLNIEKVAIAPGITEVTPLDFEQYPFSHSMVTVIGWAMLLGVIYYFIRRYFTGALVIWCCVVIHWLLDFISHRPDLPIYPGSSLLVGLGLWNSVAGTVLVEGFIFLLGIYLYLKVTHAKDKIGIFGFWVLVGLLVIIYMANLFGPTQPNVGSIAWAGQLQWLFVIWAYWVDRHRISIQDKPE